MTMPTSKAGTSRARHRETPHRVHGLYQINMTVCLIPMRFRKPKAFTFVEVVAALAIVSIALLGLLHLHLVSIKTADRAQTMAQAVFLAQERMAEASCAGHPPVGARSGTVDTNGAHFAWRTEVANVDSPQSRGLGLATLRQLRVDVAWSEGSGHKSVQMTTFIADPRVNE